MDDEVCMICGVEATRHIFNSYWATFCDNEACAQAVVSQLFSNLKQIKKTEPDNTNVGE